MQQDCITIQPFASVKQETKFRAWRKAKHFTKFHVLCPALYKDLMLNVSAPIKNMHTCL